MTKERESKIRSQIIVGSLLIISGICFSCGKLIFNNITKYKEELKIESFFENKTPTPKTININKANNKSNASQNEYVAVVEIPSINLKRGLVSKDSPLNNIKYNISILPESDTPDSVDGNVILASHSGNTRVAFFKDLYKLKLSEYVYIYYDKYKYTYEIIEIDNQEKTGTISIKNANYPTLILTTCNQQDKNKQLVISAKLIDKNVY